MENSKRCELPAQDLRETKRLIAMADEAGAVAPSLFSAMVAPALTNAPLSDSSGSITSQSSDDMEGVAMRSDWGVCRRMPVV
eukprot:jgi/Tetstr1/446608/TSEL_034132.t1